MDYTIEQDCSRYPVIRIITLGDFALERLISIPAGSSESPCYLRVGREEWSNRGPAMTLLKILLCRANRRASRDELIEAIWPDNETINGAHALDSAASVLRRHILRTHEGGSLLLTIRSGSETIFKLPAQHRLWVDADAVLELASRAIRVECQGHDPIPLLEAVCSLVGGEFLEDDLYSEWAQGRRRTIDGARHRVLYKLVDLYVRAECVSQAEELLFTCLEQNPTDEDALCRLMILLVEQERRQEALQLYQYTVDLLQEEKAEPAVYTRELAGRIRHGLVLRDRGNDYITTSAGNLSSLGTAMQSADSTDSTVNTGEKLQKCRGKIPRIICSKGHISIRFGLIKAYHYSTR
jgi:DNA-binding SARP family transcriptional activator